MDGHASNIRVESTHTHTLFAMKGVQRKRDKARARAHASAFLRLTKYRKAQRVQKEADRGGRATSNHDGMGREIECKAWVLWQLASNPASASVAGVNTTLRTVSCKCQVEHIWTLARYCRDHGYRTLDACIDICVCSRAGGVCCCYKRFMDPVLVRCARCK